MKLEIHCALFPKVRFLFSSVGVLAKVIIFYHSRPFGPPNRDLTVLAAEQTNNEEIPCHVKRAKFGLLCIRSCIDGKKPNPKISSQL